MRVGHTSLECNRTHPAQGYGLLLAREPTTTVAAVTVAAIAVAAVAVATVAVLAVAVLA
jgi:hypothetical protein